MTYALFGVALSSLCVYWRGTLLPSADTIHYWEFYHHYLGSKYYEELGYDGLYAASVAALAGRLSEKSGEAQIRDLRTNTLRPLASQLGFAADVEERFSENRWRDFEQDLFRFVDKRGFAFARIWKDHGFNASPFWTAVARLFTWPSSGEGLWVKVAYLDRLLILSAFGLLIWGFGLRTGSLAAILFAIGELWGASWVGDAFLRFGWFFSIVLAVVSLEKGFWKTAGVALAFATALRIFPFLFVAAALLALLSPTSGHQNRKGVVPFLSAYGLALGAAFLIGGAAGRGMGAWLEFADRMRLYSETVIGNAVGLSRVIGSKPAWFTGNFDALRAAGVTTVLELSLWQIVLYAVFASIYVALFIYICRKSSPAKAAATALFPFFAVTTANAYYYCLLALGPVFGNFGLSSALLAVVAIATFYSVFLGSAIAASGFLSWGVGAALLVFGIWTILRAPGEFTDGQNRE